MLLSLQFKLRVLAGRVFVTSQRQPLALQRDAAVVDLGSDLAELSPPADDSKIAAMGRMNSALPAPVLGDSEEVLAPATVQLVDTVDDDSSDDDFSVVSYSASWATPPPSSCEIALGHARSEHLVVDRLLWSLASLCRSLMLRRFFVAHAAVVIWSWPSGLFGNSAAARCHRPARVTHLQSLGLLEDRPSR